MRSKHISFLLPQDAEYPQRLKNIPDAPFALYMRGNGRAAKDMSQKTPVVAVIGARECSEYGKYVAARLGECAARFGAALVSGMAYGVDGISQHAALQEGGLVAAVLGCGCDICYPASNRSVYECLLHNGCVFSEYVPGTEPKANYFPPRNRIISGMADALIVVEAKEKSGTLITVDMALEQGRDVYVVPGRLTDPMSRGCNRLLGQGASVLFDIEETMTEIMQNGGGIKSSKREGEEGTGCKLNEPDNPYDEKSLRHAIYSVLDMEPKSIQQIYEEIHNKMPEEMWNISTLQTELLFMQMERNAEQKNGRFFRVSSAG